MPTFFGRIGWEPILHLYGNYSPDLVKEFYANMNHKIDKDFPTIIPSVKGVRIVLDKKRLSRILSIRDEGESVSVHNLQQLWLQLRPEDEKVDSPASRGSTTGQRRLRVLVHKAYLSVRHRGLFF